MINLKSKINFDLYQDTVFNEKNIIEKLKRSEKQIKNGDVIEANLVFKELREKYGY